MRSTTHARLVTCALLGVVAGSGCAHRPPARVPVPMFPLAAAWTVRLDAPVDGPLAELDERLYVTTRDGVLQALDAASGEPRWRLENAQGVTAARGNALLLLAPNGLLRRLDPATGAVLWSVSTGVAGSVQPSVMDPEVVVAGDGLAAVELRSGRMLWKSPPGGPTWDAPAAAFGGNVLLSGSDGVLRAFSRRSGAARWSWSAKGPLRASAVGFPETRDIYLGTTDRRIVRLTAGEASATQRWRWRVGSDVVHPVAVLDHRVIAVSYDAVLLSLDRGNGHLQWRAPLPSRPISPPLVSTRGILVACLEDQLVAFDPQSGRAQGAVRLPKALRTEPLVRGDRIFVALRDRSVVALIMAAR